MRPHRFLKGSDAVEHALLVVAVVKMLATVERFKLKVLTSNASISIRIKIAYALVRTAMT